MVVILACVFAACDKTDAQETNYKVTIHPNNGQADFVWEIKTDIPVITYYGYHVVGYYLDEDFTTSTTLESLKSTELTKNIDVYVKWEKDSVPPKTRITTNNLNCDIDNRLISGKVSNDTTMFSFIDEISVEKGTTYTISTDINGINTIPSKTVNLEIGDNVFYILVQNGEELTLYTATVRRKPIYTVAFDTKGGTEVQSQQVEEDGFATAPTTEKNGCTFDKWDWDFSMPITENTTITAIWNAFVYNIVYDFNIPEDSVSQEVDNSMNPTTYTVDDTIYFSAPARKGYYLTGWSVSSISKGTTGTVTTTAQWRPIIYEIVYDFGDSNSISKATNNDSNPRYYSVESEINFAEPTRAGYSFVSWDKNIEKGTTGTQTITASWNVIQHNISYVLNGWTNAESNKTTYTIEDKTFTLFDGINGESLFCGWYLDDEYTNYIETIDASTMRDYTIYAMPDCGATNGLSIENGVVNGYSGAYNEVIIPSFYKGYAVDRLVGSSFNNCVEIVSVEIPDSVKSIEQGAFSGCSSLENITIPFVGAQAGVTSRDTCQYPFGYIFGTVSYDGGVATTQYYYGYDTSRTTSTIYYIPSSLKSVIFTGEDILYGAFYNCSGLTSITFGNSVRSIGDDAFSGCSGLTSVCITDIAKWCAIRFKSFTSNPLYYAHELYLNGELVKDLTIPNGVTSIGNYAFYNYSDLTGIVLPDSVTWVGSIAFSGCNLIKITGPSDAVSTVAKQCDSKAIAEIVITSGTSIGDSAFSSCSGLISVTIPNSVTSIGKDAFYKCSGLTSVTIPDGVTSIGSDAFMGCNKLQDISIADIAAWCNISGLNYLMEYGTSDKNLYLNNELITSLIIPDGVKTIPSYAFRGCIKLTDATISSGVTVIGDEAFRGCDGLKSIIISDSVTSVGSIAFSSCNLTKITGPSTVVPVVAKQCNSTAIEEIVITSGTSIGDSAFYGCSGLTNVTIPNSVTSIGDSAFYGCSGLTGVTIPDSVSDIGNSAFEGCRGLTSVSLGNSVIRIGDCAFYGCMTLSSITIPNGVESIGGGAFTGCHRLIEVYNKSSLTIIAGKYDNGGVASNAKNVYTDTEGESKLSTDDGYIIYADGTEKILVAYIGYETDLTLPSYITQINEFAFYICTDLHSIIIPVSVTSIGYQAFYGCNGLTSITIPKSVTNIGSSAFSDCSGLTSIIVEKGNPKYHSAGNCLIETATKTLVLGCKTSGIPSDGSVTSIDSAFWGCSDLISITIPDSVTSIGYGAFYGCTGLTSITIPNSMTSIGNYAFYGCSGLTNINFEGTKAQWNAITKGGNWNDGVATDCTITCSDGTI